MDLSAKERSLAYCATGAPRRYSAIVSNRACAKPFRRGSLKNHHEHTNTSAPDARRAEAFLLLRCHVGSRRGVLRHTIFKWGFGSRLASTRRASGDVEDFTSTRRGMWAMCYSEIISRDLTTRCYMSPSSDDKNPRCSRIQRWALQWRIRHFVSLRQIRHF